MKPLALILFALLRIELLAETHTTPPDPGNPLYTGLSFYLMAHQDDWQLFMGINAYKDINVYDGKTGNKVVFIYVTAGNNWDQNRKLPVLDDMGIQPSDPFIKGPRTVPYYLIREKGAKNSIHLAASKPCLGWSMEPLPVSEYPVVNGHKIYRYTYRNTVSYFLRLEEWWVGFNLMANNPLDGGVAVDGSTTYTNWCDLLKTVAAIYTLEQTTVEQNVIPRLNIPDYNLKRNPVDHVSHLSVSRLAIEAAQQLQQNWPVNLYVDYASQQMKPNLGIPETQIEGGLVAAYCLSLVDYQIHTEWVMGACGKPDYVYQQWSAASYFETEQLKEINRIPNACACSDSYLRVLLGSPDYSAGPVKIAPDPCANRIDINWSDAVCIEACQVYTASGRAVLSIQVVGTNLQIDTAGWESGVYYAISRQGNGKIIAVRFTVLYRDSQD